MFFIAQKKRPDAVKATRKTQALYNVQFLKELGITSNNTKNGNFLRFFLIFSETFFFKRLGFLRCVQCLKMLLLSYQKNFRTIFQKFYHNGGPF